MALVFYNCLRIIDFLQKNFYQFNLLEFCSCLNSYDSIIFIIFIFVCFF